MNDRDMHQVSLDYRRDLDTAYRMARELSQSMGQTEAVRFLRKRYEDLWHYHDGRVAARFLSRRIA